MSDFLRSARRFVRRAAILPVVALAVVACDDDDAALPPEISETIAQIASGQTNLSTLVTALNSAELAETLNGAGPFTVFAPTNAAFEALPPSELARLLLPENQAELQEVLTFHVVPGEFRAADLAEGQQLTTAAGANLTITLAGGAQVNGVDIINTDIPATNGVIHIIDEVLLPPRPNIASLAGETDALSTLAAAVSAAGLVETLNGEGPFTVFAPVNAAFDALGGDVVGGLTSEAGLGTLSKVLTYHVVAGAGVYSDDLSDGQTFTTVNGEELTIGVDGGTVTVNGVEVVTANVRAGNGIVHIIDEVLVPSELDIIDVASLTSQTQTLNNLVGSAGLAETLRGAGPFTVFAPINEAFGNLPAYAVEQLVAEGNVDLLTEVLTYHVVPGAVLAGDLTDGGTATTVEGRDLTFDLSGATPQVNGVNIIETDIQTANGVIHLVDGVIVPEFDIVETATVTEGFATLVAALGAAELVETLKGAGPFTVFAPVDAAFEALGEYTLGQLLDAANQGILADILTYHVVPGAVLAGDLTDGGTATTVEGGDLTFDLSGATPQVNGVNIIDTDIEVENGVIHVIDGVLTESVNIAQRSIITEQTETLTAAVVAGDLVTTLEGAGPFTVFAPINEAFAALGTDRLDVLLDPANQALLQKVLTYHVVPGDVRLADVVALGDGASVATVEGSEVTFDLSDPNDPKVNGASIIATDIVTENGVIHLVDGVLTENLDIVDVAVVNGFSTLVELVAGQGLAETLRDDNGGAGFTVFAPTNAAFDALAAVPEGDALTQVLLYHVVGATVFEGDLTDGQVVTTANAAGDTFTVNLGDSVTITDGAGNTVNVTVTDVAASNGVIHVVDAVLLPPAAPAAN